MLTDSPYALGVIFVTLALMWVLQMSLAKKQATGFLSAVNSIKGPGLEVAIGVNPVSYTHLTLPTIYPV